MARYSEIRYNESQYNFNSVTAIISVLDEITTRELNKALSESVSSADVMFSQSVDRAYPGSVYNQLRYNEGQYNQNRLWEFVSALDIDIIREIMTRRNDTIFVIDVLTKQITNKGLSDTLRPSGWLSKNRVDETTWSD